MVAVNDEEALHELKVSKVVVRLVVQELQVLLVHNTLHGLGNGRRSLECLCEDVIYRRNAIHVEPETYYGMYILCIYKCTSLSMQIHVTVHINLIVYKIMCTCNMNLLQQCRQTYNVMEHVYKS